VYQRDNGAEYGVGAETQQGSGEERQWSRETVGAVEQKSRAAVKQSDSRELEQRDSEAEINW
jgi:hypothetical protein